MYLFMGKGQCAVAREKKRKIEQDGDVSVGQEQGLSMSIGSLFGKPDIQTEDSKDKPKQSTPPPLKASANPMDVNAFLLSLTQATLHREASGRGGRTVTIVGMKPEPNTKLAEEIAKAMRKGLGCGSHVEGTKVVLQGDIQERAEAWLTKQGTKKVVMGN